MLKRLIDYLDTAQGVLSEARNKIAKGFEDLREYQDTFAAKNEVPGVDRSDILNINAGGVMMSVTSYTLIHIKGTRL